VRSSKAGHPTPVEHVLGCTCRMSSFRPCSPAEVRRTIMKSLVKSCSLDPVTTFLLREFVNLLLPFVTCMVNTSLRQGRLPKSQRHAIVVPVLKKPGLNTVDMANFRPVFDITFMSKIVERVLLWLRSYMDIWPLTTYYHAISPRTAAIIQLRPPCCV